VNIEEEDSSSTTLIEKKDYMWFRLV
jgi:hypothetical protein